MKAERQHLTLKWSYRRCRERHRFALVHRLIADRVQHRVFIDFIDCHCDCFTIAEACRTIVLTTTSNVYVPGPCASVGVQVKTPVAGSMAAPDGTVPVRLWVNVW